MNIYNMKLHNAVTTENNIHITRVPGGWIYNYLIRNYTVFIPYNDEFNKDKQRAIRQNYDLQMAALTSHIEYNLKKDNYE